MKKDVKTERETHWCAMLSITNIIPKEHFL
jgi:hypothetical protein